MDDSTFKFLVTLIVGGFILIVVISWLWSRFEESPYDREEERRFKELLKELNRHKDE